MTIYGELYLIRYLLIDLYIDIDKLSYSQEIFSFS